MMMAVHETWRRFTLLTRDIELMQLAVVHVTMGLSSALLVTTMSLFLLEEVQATPLLIGLFFGGRALLEIGSDLAVGVLSDRLPRRRLVLALCAGLAALGALFYIWVRDYVALFVIGGVLFGVGGASFAQLFAYTREFAEHRGGAPVHFNARFRALTSATWMIGPPIAFAAVDVGGFEILYGAVFVLNIVAAVTFAFGLPDTKRATVPLEQVDDPVRVPGPRILAVLAATVLLLAANAIYQVNLALFVTRDLGLHATVVGVVLAVGCALEIPLVIMVGARADVIGKRNVMMAGALFAVLFFIGLPLVRSPTAMLLLQVPNAVWVAIVLSIPVVYLQDLLPRRVGLASALYSGSFKAGGFIGGIAAGVGAHALGYAATFWGCALLAATAGALLVTARN